MKYQDKQSRCGLTYFAENKSTSTMQQDSELGHCPSNTRVNQSGNASLIELKIMFFLDQCQVLELIFIASGRNKIAGTAVIDIIIG